MGTDECNEEKPKIKFSGEPRKYIDMDVEEQFFTFKYFLNSALKYKSTTRKTDFELVELIYCSIRIPMRFNFFFIFPRASVIFGLEITNNEQICL